MAGAYTKSDQQPPEPVPSDYDENPGRLHLARSPRPKVIRRGRGGSSPGKEGPRSA
jgi:hypothetical protein